MVGAEEKAGGPDLASSHVPYRTSSPSAPQALGPPRPSLPNMSPEVKRIGIR